jgi:hypothetical protein
LQFAICNLQTFTLLCVCVLFLLSFFATASPAAELKWRSGRTAMSKVSQPARSTAEQQFMRPRVPNHRDELSANTETTDRAKSANGKRIDMPAKSNALAAGEPAATSDDFAQANKRPESEPSIKDKWASSTKSAAKADQAVMQAAFEDEGPQLTSGDEGQANLRSVIVDREEEFDFTRSAQLPETSTDADQTGSTPPPATNNQTDLDDQLEQDLRLPFGTANESGQAAPLDGTLQQPTDDLPIASPAQVERDRQRADASCNDSLAKLRAKTIDTVNISIAVSGNEGTDFPFECTLDQDQWHEGRSWEQTTFLWKASALCHKPLYFEDPQLERYGHSFPPCCQPLISGAHFFTRLPVLPYCMGVEPPMECIYSLGHYRPGSCAPYMFEPIPLSYRGALFQAGAVVGAAAALP